MRGHVDDVSRAGRERGQFVRTGKGALRIIRRFYGVDSGSRPDGWDRAS
jgi:hypothetical protein